MKTTTDYLIDNRYDINTGIYFTLKDYEAISKYNYDKICIHKDNSEKEETLTKKQILDRLKELYTFYKKNKSNGIKNAYVEEILSKNNIDI